MGYNQNNNHKFLLMFIKSIKKIKIDHIKNILRVNRVKTLIEIPNYVTKLNFYKKSKGEWFFYGFNFELYK